MTPSTETKLVRALKRHQDPEMPLPDAAVAPNDPDSTQLTVVRGAWITRVDGVFGIASHHHLRRLLGRVRITVSTTAPTRFRDDVPSPFISEGRPGIHHPDCGSGDNQQH